MLWEVIENYLVDCITTELKKRPLGTRVTEDELLGSLPDFEVQENGDYKITYMSTVLDESDLTDIVIRATTKLEDAGYFVEGYCSNGYRLFEKVKPDDDLDLATLVEMEYREKEELVIGADRGFTLRGRTLSEVENPISKHSAHSVVLSDDQFSELCKLLDNAGAQTWKD